MSDQIDQIMNQTRRYMYEDGLVEIAIGMLFLIVGIGLFAWLAFTDVSSALGVTLILILLMTAIVGGFLIKRAVGAVKERITYPRTGYVSYKQEDPSRSRWLVIVSALLVAMCTIFLPEELARMSTLIGALLGVVLVVIGYRLSINRFYLLGILSLSVGLAASVLFDQESIGAAASLFTVGMMLVISGSFALYSYLKHHPQTGGDAL